METAVKVKLEMEGEFSEPMDRLNSGDIPDKGEIHRSAKSSQCSAKDSSSLSRCRLCALPKNDMVDIFGLSETEDDNIAERIQYCLRIVVKATDTLPRQACQSCLEELELCYQFNKIVEEAEAQLLSLDKQISGKLEASEKNGESSSEHAVQSSYTVIPKVESVSSAVETESKKPPTIAQEGEITDGTVKLSPVLPSLKIRYRVPVFDETQYGYNFNKNRKRGSSDYDYKHAELSIDDLNCVKKSKPHMTRSKSRTKIAILRSEKRFEESENQGVPQKAGTRKTRPGYACRRERHPRYNDYDQSNECFVCKKTFNTFSAFQRHKRAHMENGDYHCSTCNKLFKNEGRLRQHMIVHERDPWRCDYCDKECEFKSILERHVNSCKKRPHIVEQPHKCRLCPKVFKNKHNLRKHYEFHRGTEFYSCQYCGMAFTSKTERDCHRLVHAVERPFKCTICGWMFADSNGLRLHETLHLQKKTHHCSICDKSFRLLSRMKLHMAVHTTDRPWQCNYCENWFKSKEVIRQHVLICKNRH